VLWNAQGADIIALGAYRSPNQSHGIDAAGSPGKRGIRFRVEARQSAEGSGTTGATEARLYRQAAAFRFALPAIDQVRQGKAADIGPVGA
jgi:hypothetical protein